ncbi:hypothetical protein WJX72_007400 [[Myrmecia] bisecta]|uniref:Uncharacterized protein n=1 Tax=[Myrmecia] bisecta TaxID=41462 RepID=A0AAW1PLN0_9CHLO
MQIHRYLTAGGTRLTTASAADADFRHWEVRTGLVWGIDLAIYYSGIGNGRLGERWRAGSILELVGFIISLIGVVLYSQANSRVAQAHNRVKRAGVSPRSADAKKICRDVFAPQHCGIPMAEADQSDNAIKANYETFPSPAYTVEEPAPMPLIQRISWRRTLQAHSSWLLDPHQVDPADHVGPTSFSGFTLVNPRLPPLRIPETVVEEDIEASADVVGAAAPAQAPAQPEVDMAGESGDTDDVDDSDEVPAF